MNSKKQPENKSFRALFSRTVFLSYKDGGGDGTCTRVPTQDNLTFFVHSLLKNVAEIVSKQAIFR